MGFLGTSGILHIIVTLVFDWLILCLLIRVLISWLPISPGHPIPRFFNIMTDPVLEPVRKRIPSMGIGFFDVSAMVAYIFVWWALQLLMALINYALPVGW